MWKCIKLLSRSPHLLRFTRLCLLSPLKDFSCDWTRNKTHSLLHRQAEIWYMCATWISVMLSLCNISTEETLMSLTLGTCVPYTKKNPSDLGRSKVIPAYYTSDTENLDYTMSHGWEHWWMSFMAWGYPILSRNLQCDCNQRSSGGHQRLNSNTLVVCNALINLLQLLQFFCFYILSWMADAFQHGIIYSLWHPC